MSNRLDSLFARLVRAIPAGASREFSAKHKVMNEQTPGFPGKKNGLIKLPAYPVSGRELFGEVRRLLEKELQGKLTVRRLSKMLGMPASTIHYWLESCAHPHLIGFMSLLERLSPFERYAFIDTHCRLRPSFTHPWMVDNPASRTHVFTVLRKKAGLTLISRGVESSQRFILSAFGNCYATIDGAHKEVWGIDLRRPTDYLPIDSLYYLDGTSSLDAVRASVNKIWPKIITSKASLILFNRLWSALPEVRADILRLAQNRHVVLADIEFPGPADLRRIRGEVHQLTISEKYHGPRQIRLTFRRIKFKKPSKTALLRRKSVQ